jgi:small conductance mechanosensitive channel
MKLEIQDVWSLGSDVFSGGLLQFILHCAVTWLVAWLLCRFFRRVTKKAAALRGEKSVTSLHFLYSTMKTIIYAIAIFLCLENILALKGISTAILGSASILAVIVGLAAQETFGNFISGFFLAIYQPFQVGDIITLPEKNITGTVTAVTIRNTTLKTYENSTLIIPNSVADSAIIENKNSGTDPYTRYMNITVAYDADIDLIRKIVCQVLAETAGVVDPRTVEQKAAGSPIADVLVWDFLTGGMQIHFGISARTFGDSFGVFAEVREKLIKAFRQNGITIPYQTITLTGAPQDAPKA